MHKQFSLMKKIIVCNWVSLDGFFSGIGGETDWFYWNDEVEAYQLAAQKTVDMLLFGRKTYDIMAGYWPTPFAINEHPAIIHFMNETKKIIFSKSLTRISWENCTLLPDISKEKVENLLATAEGDILIFGSGSIASQLMNLDLIDELRLFINPIVLGKGRSMFQHVHGRINWQHDSSKTFSNGMILHIFTK